MSSFFSKGRFTGNSFEYICSFDPSIDWENSEVDEDEYKEDPVKHKGALRFFDDQEPTVFNCHYLTQSEFIYCLQKGNIQINPDAEEDGESLVYVGPNPDKKAGLLLGLALCAQAAARVSIDSVDELDENIKVRKAGRISEVTDDFLEKMGSYDVAILEELGSYVWNSSKPKKKKSMG